MFLGKNNTDQLVKITERMGTIGLRAYLTKFDIQLDKKEFPSLTNYPAQPWSSCVNVMNEHLCTGEAIDLLSKLLVYDHVGSL